MKFILNFSIIILLIFAFLNVEHFYPWTTYDAEKYIFYAFSVFVLYFIFNDRKNIKIDTHVLFLILLFFCSLNTYQDYIFKQYYYVFNLYLINLIILSGVLKNYFIKSNKLLDVVMVALIISGVLSSVISIYQWLDFAKGSLWLYEVRSTRFSANLAQPNHLATLLLLSLFSCLYFFNKLKIVYILIFIPLLLFSLVLTQSRAAWLALIIIVILNILKWKEITSSVKIIIFSLIPLYMGIVNLLSRSNQSNVADRVHSGFERLAIWKDFFCVFPHLNFWGNGWKNVEYYQFQYGNNFFVYLSSYHNLLLDLLVIFGIIGGVFFIYIFINLLRIFFRIKSERDFIVFLMLFVLINHSLLEFPLFYNYFLFVFCVLYFYLNSKYSSSNIEFNVGNNFFSILVVPIIIASFFYSQAFEKNRGNYRAAFLGYCVAGLEKNILFDEFNNLAFINCRENISLNNISYFEKGLLQRPSSNNILKLIYVYHQVGEYDKRDILLRQYNAKYLPKYTLYEVLQKKFF